MNSNLYVIGGNFAEALCPEDVFGPVVDEKDLKARYRLLVVVVHPDHYPDPEESRFASTLFEQLNVWHAEALRKLGAKTYGDRSRHAAPAPPPPFHEQVIETRARKYHVVAPLAHGDVADLYRCTYTDGAREVSAVFKIARSSGDNDLLTNEDAALRELHKAKVPGAKDERFTRFLPGLVESFLLRGKGSPRRVNVLELANGYVSLAEIMAAYPGGLDSRDAVWMFKRALAALGWVHKTGRVHGAVLPPHLLVHPTEHGAKLVGWSYSVRAGEKVKAISKPYRELYAPEVLAKAPATAATDIFMLAKTIGQLLLPGAPKEFLTFLRTCLFPAPSRRPTDAWQLHTDLDEMLARVVGPRKYRPLVMPAK